ncbi:ATP-binding protein [Novosphingobium mangrovi (ex Huang et al. 2023)]|uniref:histidine kinase n=1 Tax=Novosphingobium mangrovi (ex Huang et al. 2023) TaxID=2976432 RepID=A0ABT2I7E0_9SPHN|nr:ATP-binding protein [Novosphingobium mangrovi (ex Huang et al. 2023)]MCT2400714.1 ATP-binding protein [Novosphingobium mangrovi (ex Huang et al. 2023)]
MKPLPDRTGRLPDALVVALALVFSVALVWLVSGDGVLATVFMAAMVVFAALAWFVTGRRQPEAEPEFAQPDWSVTVAAIDRPDMAIAMTDRAGRLTCANATHEAWFGVNSAPPRLPVDDASVECLADATRVAWRDGFAQAEIAGHHGEHWWVEVHRSGRGDDFLVWRVIRLSSVDLVAELVGQIDGKLGRGLAKAGIVTALVDPDGSIRAASTGFAQRATGDVLADMTGRDFVDLLSQEEGERIGWAREGGRGAALVLYHVPVADPDAPGEPDPNTTPSLMLVVEAGQGIGASATGTAAAPHLEALLSQLPLGLAMADRDGRLLFANPAFMRAAGREGQAAPTYPTDLVVKEDKRALSESIRRFAQGPATAGDIAVRLAAQPDDPVSLSLAGVRGLGEAAVLLGLTDTSEETRLKRQVAQATKMQAVGQLAGGVAHDFNNVLTATLGTCDLMLMRHTPGDSDYDDIQQIRANSNRAASLTRQLLAFSRQQTLRPEVLQLPDVVADVSQMLRRLIGEKIQLVVTHDRDLGPVRADPTQLEQVIVNLAVNARDAMQSRKGGDGSGKLTLATRRVTTTDVREMRSEIIPAGEYTALIVEDTGGGIPPEHLGKIFEPFFTTKEQGKGTGLGLSTVYGIVKQSGGFIFAESEVGKGTRFIVYLPVYHVAPGTVSEPAAEKVEAAPSQWAGGGRILLVEDEDPVRMVAERSLTRQGYEVTSARDGEEGLILVEEGGEFDLVVSDVVMPTMDGPAMARKIRKIAPELPVLFMSGYAEEQLRKEIGIANAWFMPKPFSVQQLSEKVGDVLARTAK